MNKKDKTLVVNFLSGPGAGKSTMCAHTFAELKWNDVNCEMAYEYAKLKVWEESFITLDNQLYVFAKQSHSLYRLRDKVDVILTDSPLLLTLMYDAEKNPALAKLALLEFSRYRNLNFFIRRSKEDNSSGRMQTETEARIIDEGIVRMLNEYKIPYQVVDGDRDSIPEIVSNVIKQIK